MTGDGGQDSGGNPRTTVEDQTPTVPVGNGEKGRPVPELVAPQRYRKRHTPRRRPTGGCPLLRVPWIRDTEWTRRVWTALGTAHPVTHCPRVEWSQVRLADLTLPVCRTSMEPTPVPRDPNGTSSPSPKRVTTDSKQTPYTRFHHSRGPRTLLRPATSSHSPQGAWDSEGSDTRRPHRGPPGTQNRNAPTSSLLRGDRSV